MKNKRESTEGVLSRSSHASTSNKERALALKDWEVFGILEGRKTQVRIPVKVRERNSSYILCRNSKLQKFHNGVAVFDNPGWYYTQKANSLPFGVGDTLWVKESFADLNGMGIQFFEGNISYKSGLSLDSLRAAKEFGVKWLPAGKMKRSQSRISMKVKSIRLELVNHISYRDSIEEGVSKDMENIMSFHHPRRKDLNPKEVFGYFWGKKFGRDNWEMNSWVWVIEFDDVKIKECNNVAD